MSAVNRPNKPAADVADPGYIDAWREWASVELDIAAELEGSDLARIIREDVARSLREAHVRLAPDRSRPFVIDANVTAIAPPKTLPSQPTYRSDWREWAAESIATTSAYRSAGQPMVASMIEAFAAAAVIDAGAALTPPPETVPVLMSHPDTFDLSPAWRKWRYENGLATEADNDRSMLARVRENVHERRVQALSALLAGERNGYGSIHEAFSDIEGRPFDAAAWNRLMGQTFVAGNHDFEAVSSVSWTSVLGDAVNRRLAAEYTTMPGSQTWRRLVSNIRTGIDFRTQHIGRLGSYGPLPVVPEGAPFQAVSTTADVDIAYKPDKRGGEEAITLEAFANDDVAAFQRIPRLLARSAALAVNRSVLDVFPLNAPIYDGVNLFASGHANTNALALSPSNVTLVRKQLRLMPAFGESTDILAATPRYLIVGAELEELALSIVQQFRSFPGEDPELRPPFDVIVSPWITSPTAWYVTADPKQVETIEIGFSGPTDEPQIIITGGIGFDGDGRAFSNDTISIKIRHSWAKAVVDYRGLIRGNS